MNILIAYASNSGNTLYVSERIAEALQKAGHAVTVRNIAELSPRELADYELCVLGSPTWLQQTAEGPREGQLTQQWQDFAERVRGADLPTERRFAVFGLGRHEYTRFCGAADELEKLVGDLRGKLVVESLRFDGFPQHRDIEVGSWVRRLIDALPKPASRSIS